MAANVRRKKYALYSQVGDSFFFTSTQHAEDFDITRLSLDTDVHLLEVTPCPSSLENVTPLGSLVPRKPDKPAPTRSTLPNSETIPVQFLNYGPYLTFAPTTDTTAATLTLDETIRVRQYQMQQMTAAASAFAGQDADIEDNESETTCATSLGEDVPHRTPEMGDSVINADDSTLVDALAEDEVNVDALVDMLRGSGDANHNGRQRGAVNVVDEILKQNSDLLAALARIQDRRLASDTPDDIPKEEIALARLVSRGLAALANMSGPSQFMTPEAAERTMVRLRRFDAAYRGTLPEGRLNAFSAGAVSTVPVTADTTEPVAAQ